MAGSSPMVTPSHLLRRVSSRPSLLTSFLLASATILSIGAVALGAALSEALTQHAMGEARRTAEADIGRLIAPHVVRGDRIPARPPVPASVADELAERRADIVSVKIWRPDGTLAWTNLDPRRAGHRFPVSRGLAAALRHGATTTALVHSISADEVAERAAENRSGAPRLLEVYAPLRGASGRPVGAYEVYVDARQALGDAASGRQLIWLVTAAVFLGLWITLAALVREATRRLRRQDAALEEAYGALERRSVEAVESLNATLEARDPSGAGRGASVERLALAIGRELGLCPAELRALATGARLHDIGNVAVPDALLAKPGPLTAEEYELVKLHADEGAAILYRLSPLREVVPMVRHHHERWDGTGYPDGLAGDSVPLGAAVIAVAEAWTAMTSDRPYRWGLAPEEALENLLAGRGTQFSPEVVDAFLRGAGERPNELLLNRPGVAAGLLSDR